MPITPEAFNFHAAGPITSVNTFSDNIDGAIYDLNTPPLAMSTTDSQDGTVVKGHEATLLRFEGLPANTVCLEIKYIHHYEGTPAINFNTILIPADEEIKLADPVQVERVRKNAILNDLIRVIPSYVQTGIQGYQSGGTVGALTSMMAKLGLSLV